MNLVKRFSYLIWDEVDLLINAEKNLYACLNHMSRMTIGFLLSNFPWAKNSLKMLLLIFFNNLNCVN